MKLMKFTLLTSLTLLLAGCAADQVNSTPLAADDLANMQRLVGNWRVTYYHFGGVTRNSQPYHLEYSLQGNDLIVTSVMDQDTPFTSSLKGDRAFNARFRLNGRRAYGTGGTPDLRGTVSENFSTIYWTWPSNVTYVNGGSPVYQYETDVRE